MSEKDRVEGFAKIPPRKSNRLRFRPESLLFAGIGVFLLGIDLFLYLHTRQQLSNAVRTQGTVIDLIRTSKKNATLAPKVSFVAKNGETYMFISSVGTNPPEFEKGQRVSIYYDPQSPKQAFVDSFLQLWFVNVILTVLALPFLGIGLALAWNR
jgi:hypothetical protein